MDKEFVLRDEALIWIISTQVARRNLTPIQLSYFRGVHYNADKRVVKNAAGANQHSEKEVSTQNGYKPQNLNICITGFEVNKKIYVFDVIYRF